VEISDAMAEQVVSAPPCPACGGPLSAWRRAPSAEPSTSETFALARCGRCGTAVTLGEAPAPAVHETGAYAGGAPRLSRLAGPILRAFDRRRLRMLRPVTPPPAHLLDAGAGRGRFVAAALRAGYDAQGIEPAARGALARTEHGVTLAAETVESASFAPGSLDAVTLWHVLEHLEDPGAALERVAGWVAPGGALLVGVPNLASLQARIGGNRWFHLDLPRHRTHFTAAGLEALLVRTGFTVVRTHHVLAEHNPFGMWQSAVNRVTRTPSYAFNLLKRNAPLLSPDLLVTLLALPLVPVAIVAELLAGLARRGGTVAVVARREGSGPAR
jgi:SAM-dependent methyltransferase